MIRESPFQASQFQLTAPVGQSSTAERALLATLNPPCPLGLAFVMDASEHRDHVHSRVAALMQLPNPLGGRFGHGL